MIYCFIAKKQIEVIVCRKNFLYLRVKNKRKENYIQMTMCYPHMNVAMRMWAMMSTTMMMALRG